MSTRGHFWDSNTSNWLKYPWLKSKGQKEAVLIPYVRFPLSITSSLDLIYLHFKLAGAVFECEFRMFLTQWCRGFPGGYLRQAISPVKWHYSHTHMILHIVARDFQNMSQAWTGNKKEGRYLISLYSWGMLKIIVRSEFIWFSMQHFYYLCKFYIV